MSIIRILKKLSSHMLHTARLCESLSTPSLVKYLLFSQIKRKIKFQIRGIRGPTVLRGGTSDIALLHGIFGLYEYPRIHDSSVNTIVDAGANVGLASLFYARMFPRARIYAIEPSIKNFQMLERNVATYDRIIPIYAALTASGIMAVQITNENAEPFSHKTAPTQESGATAVPALTLANLRHKYGLAQIDLLKMDIEGMEGAVIPDSIGELRHIHHLVLEVHSGQWKSVFDSLVPLAYDCSLRYENIWIKLGTSE